MEAHQWCIVWPGSLEAINRAFDLAWAEIAINFGTEPRTIDKARLALAKAILSIASDESRDVEVLKRAALERMALDYRE